MTEVRRAVILAVTPGAWRVVGGLPLVVRGALVLRGAGIREIAVFAPVVPDAARRAAEARRLGVHWLATPGAARDLEGPDSILVLAGDVLIDSEALAPLLAAGRRDVSRTGVVFGESPDGAARVAVCPGSALSALVSRVGTEMKPLADALAEVGVPAGPPVPLGEGLFVPLDAAHPPAVLETILLDRLARRTASADSYLASVIDRRLSRPITRLVLDWPVTPSQITLASLLVGLLGAIGLATVSYTTRIAGLLALVASIVLDCVDGEVARARLEQSAAGARLDVMGDYLVHLATFTGLGVGLARQGLPPAGAWAVAALAGGVGVALGTMHVLFVRPALMQGGDLHWTGGAGSFRGTSVATVVEKVASRDYTYVLLVFALLGHLEWFLYAAAAGSWAFVAGLIGYWTLVGASRRRPVASR